MNTRRQRWIYLFCFSLSSGLAQQNAPAGQSEAPPAVPLASANRRITLDVVVNDKSGKPVPGLAQQDFKLLDNKQPQTILSFDAIQGPASAAAPPVEVILLIDEVNTAFSGVAYEREQVVKFLQENGGQLEHPTSMIFLSDSGAEIGKGFSRDGNALVAELNQRETALRSVRKSQGVYGATDRIQLSLQTVEQLAAYEAARPGRKLVIWISPGWPILSGPRDELTSKDQQRLFGNIVALSGALRQARITLYSIDPLGTNDAGGFRTIYYEEFVKGVKKANGVHLGNLALQVLVVQTGGRVINSDNDIAKAIATSVADANAFYVLTFDGLPGDGPNEYHALDLKVDKPGLTARTRTGYYAQP
jgi:VWFA-related protein